MFKNYFKIAWRNLLKNRVYSFINIFGLAIGMAVTIIISLWIADEISYDKYFKNYDSIAQVYQSQTFNGKVGTGQAIPRPLEGLLKEEYGDNFKHISMSSWTTPLYLKYNDNNISRSGNFMQEAALQIFDFKIIKGVENGLKEMYRVLKPGGRLLILEFSKPKVFPVKQAYNFYFKFVTPTIGRIFSKDSSAYTYLPESVAAFPDGEKFNLLMQKVGFLNTKFRPLTFGICSIYIGSK